jgi:hypothetical protein
MDLRDVVVRWHNETEDMAVTVAVGGVAEMDDDDSIFFYFSDWDEFELAKTNYDNDFMIVGEA